MKLEQQIELMSIKREGGFIQYIFQVKLPDTEAANRKNSYLHGPLKERICEVDISISKHGQVVYCGPGVLEFPRVTRNIGNEIIADKAYIYFLSKDKLDTISFSFLERAIIGPNIG